jgi:ATP-dependent protease HslVU (ClpYQ) peptidase subunit
VTTLCCFAEPDGPTWIGSDQQSTAGDVRERSDVQKWIQLAAEGGRPEIWVGWTGELCAGKIIARAIERTEFKDADAYADAAREELRRLGWKGEPRESGDAPYIATMAVISIGGHLSELDLGTGVAEAIPVGDFRAFGTGRRFALGAAEALRDTPAHHRLVEAIRAGMRYDVYSGGAAWIACLERST